MRKNGTLEYRVCQLEKSMQDLITKMDQIRTNELLHLKNDIIKLTEEVESLRQYLTYATVFNVGAIIIGLLISRVIR